MVVEQIKIAHLLKILKGFIDSKSTNAYTQGVLIKGNEMIATNLELTCIAKFENISNETFILPLKAIDYILMLPNGMIEILQEDDNLLVTSGKRHSKFTLMPAEEFPNIKTDDAKEKNIIVDAGNFVSAVNKVLYACAMPDSATQPIMTGVKIEAEDGRLNIVACDGNRLSWNVTEANGKFDEVLPKALLQKLNSLNATGDMSISVANNKIIVKTKTFTLISKLYSGIYFAWKKLFEKEFKNKVVIDRNEVADCVSRAIICGEGHKPMIIDVVSGTDEIIVKNSDTSIEFEEIIKSDEVAKQDLKIGLNAKLLFESIKSYDDTDVDMYYRSSNEAILFDDNTLKTIIMPVRLKGTK